MVYVIKKIKIKMIEKTAKNNNRETDKSLIFFLNCKSWGEKKDRKQMMKLTNIKSIKASPFQHSIHHIYWCIIVNNHFYNVRE